MNNFILIDGIAFWILLLFFIFMFMVFLLVGNGYIKSRQEIYLKDRQLKKLRSDYNILIGEYHRATFKVPELNTVNNNDTKKQNTKVD